jgi:hypothetical protein
VTQNADTVRDPMNKGAIYKPGFRSESYSPVLAFRTPGRRCATSHSTSLAPQLNRHAPRPAPEQLTCEGRGSAKALPRPSTQESQCLVGGTLRRLRPRPALRIIMQGFGGVSLATWGSAPGGEEPPVGGAA